MISTQRDDYTLGIPNNDANMLTIANHVKELEELRSAFGLVRMHLLGHSWGGMLAIEYALQYPDNLISLILCSAIVSVPKYLQNVEELKDKLPMKRRKLSENMKVNTIIIMQLYDAAAMKWYRELFADSKCGLLKFNKLPFNAILDMFSRIWGPSELVCNGTLKM